MKENGKPARRPTRPRAPRPQADPGISRAQQAEWDGKPTAQDLKNWSSPSWWARRPH